MSPAKCCLIVLAMLFGRLSAQMPGGLVLTTPSRIQYPPIARAAHVEGDVVVRFSIDSDGRTTSVQTLSGSPMLQPLVEGQIKEWRFRVPLPADAQSDFEAVYKFRLRPPEESLDEDLEAPPFQPCCGDLMMLPPEAAQITAEVRSTDGRQTIDVASTLTPKDSCPDEKNKQVPDGSDAGDFIDLFRACSEGCMGYRVRVYRDARVEWHGRDEVALKGEARARISSADASALFAKFQSQSFWSACSVPTPSVNQDRDAGDLKSGTYLTAKIAGCLKSVNLSTSFADDSGKRLMWALEKTANTHRWRHGDSISEPFSNMNDDLSIPKPRMTALMRMTDSFTWEGKQTLEPLKHLIAAGADIEAEDESGWTALMYAAELNSDDRAVDLLIEAHANVNRTSLHGDTALMMAAYGGRLSESLLKAGADMNAGNADGVTPLMFLAQHINPDELRRAIAAGAEAAAQDREGRTAVDYLRAASCQKAIVPLPKPWMQIGRNEPLACPSNSEGYLKSEGLLKAAMKKKPR